MDRDEPDDFSESTDVDGMARTQVMALVPSRRLDAPFGPGDVIGEYVVERKLRETPLGTLYLARHPVIGKEAAIKVIRRALCARPDTLSHLAEGARSLNQLAHPNLGQIFAFGPLADGRCYFAFDWWRGETLSERLERGTVPIPDVIEILDEACRGLAAAHEQGVLHRDLRPENLFLLAQRTSDGAGRVKLYDFALAGFERAGEGPPHHSPPERVQGKAYDARSEVYSLGTIAYHMLAGEAPFRAADPIDVLAMHLTKTAPRLRQKNAAVPPPLEELVAKMMAKNPAKRPSLREVRAALSPLHRRRAESHSPALGEATPSPRARLASAPGPASSAPVYLGRPERRRPRRKLPFTRIALGAAAIVAVLGLGSLLLGRGRPTPRAEAPPPAARLVPVAAASATPLAAGPSAAPADQVGTLVVRVSWPDAEVAIDGQPVARGGGIVRIPAVTAGNHEVSATSPTHEAFRRTVLVTAGTEIEVVVDETPPPPAVAKVRPSAPVRQAPVRRARRKERDREEKPAAAKPSPARESRPVSPDGILNPFHK